MLGLAGDIFTAFRHPQASETARVLGADVSAG
jgi:hypothetical protein